MTDLVIPLQVLYAGLGGTLLALIVATAQNQWSPRVFFLLALRLAIGWHFLFEGLHKVHSHLAGPTDTNRVFTSEPYFKVAPGPVGAYMRKQFDDPETVIAAKVKSAETIAPVAFERRSVDDQAKACPDAVAQDLDQLADQIKADEAKLLKGIDGAEQKGQIGLTFDADKAAVQKVAEAAREAVKKQIEAETAAQPAALKDVTVAKATYARWVIGVDRRPTKVKSVTGEAALTAPERLAHLDYLRREVRAAEDRLVAGLGNGHGVETKRAAEVRAELVAAEAELAKDADAFVSELKRDLGVLDAAAIADSLKTKLTTERNVNAFVDDLKKELTDQSQSQGQRMDKITMWFLVVVGGCLMAGLLTRVMCLLGAGFLVVTYLAHPPFPWYPLPPGTEGNPLFINKNVIECLALLALASMPTGRWLGLDAILMRLFCRRKDESAAPAA